MAMKTALVRFAAPYPPATRAAIAQSFNMRSTVVQSCIKRTSITQRNLFARCVSSAPTTSGPSDLPIQHAQQASGNSSEWLRALTSTSQSPPARSRRPVGAFRGGLLGFFFGLTAAMIAGSVYFKDDYESAASDIFAAAEKVRASTSNISTAARRIDSLDDRVNAISDEKANFRDVERVRAEMKQVYNGIMIELHDLKQRIEDLEGASATLDSLDSSSAIILPELASTKEPFARDISNVIVEKVPAEADIAASA